MVVYFDFKNVIFVKFWIPLIFVNRWTNYYPTQFSPPCSCVFRLSTHPSLGRVRSWVVPRHRPPGTSGHHRLGRPLTCVFRHRVTPRSQSRVKRLSCQGQDLLDTIILPVVCPRRNTMVSITRSIIYTWRHDPGHVLTCFGLRQIVLV